MPPPVSGGGILFYRIDCSAIGTADRADVVYAVQGCDGIEQIRKYIKFDREMLLR